MKTYVSSWQCLAELFLGWKHFRVKVAEIVKTSRLCLQGLAWNFIFTIFDKTFWAFVKHLDPVCRDWREILYLRFLTKIFLAFVKTSRLCLQGLSWNFIFTIFDKNFFGICQNISTLSAGTGVKFYIYDFWQNFFGICQNISTLSRGTGVKFYIYDFWQKFFWHFPILFKIWQT